MKKLELKLEKLKFVEEDKEKTAFYASDFLKSNLDLYFSFTGEKKTNPAKWTDTLKWGAGNGVEAQMLKILKQSGFVDENYDQKEHGRIDIQREGITIHGYIDALMKDGTPIEIKSINNKNDFDINKYQNGYPRENYVGQLSIYLDAKELDVGYLFVASIDGLHTFCLKCERVRDRIFKCGKITVDLDKEYKRWANLYNTYVKTKTLPDVNQYLYKYDVDTLDWTKVPKSTISKARNGKAVVGDWQITYSPWADKVIEMQGTSRGYSNQELMTILEKTAGYTTWDSRQK